MESVLFILMPDRSVILYWSSKEISCAGASLKQLQLVIQALQMARAMPVPNGEDTIVQE